MHKIYIFFLFFAFGLATVACSKTDSKPPSGSSAELNAAAPDFTLKDLAGRNISLSDYKGKVVLLEFWATWCPPCKASVPALIELKKKYEQKGFIVIGVSIDSDSDSSEKVRQFSASYNINYPVLLADETTSKIYNVMSIPTGFLIGKDGKIADIYRGYSEDFDKRVSAQIENLL
jgi:cytochrome c biogenesis protein CcmG/thiol:disulfide interchange protein DsbE